LALAMQKNNNSRMAFCFLTIFVILSGPSAAAYDYYDFEKNDLAQLEKTSTPLLFSACRYNGQYFEGRLILIVPIGSSQGHVVDLSPVGHGQPRVPVVSNDAKIELLPTPKVTELLMGAQGAFALQQEGLDFLLTQKFTYLAPKFFYRLRTLVPSARCPPNFWQ